MKLKENRKEAWEEILEKESKTSESRKELRFVMQWVALMEMEVSNGISIERCAKKTLVDTSNQFIGGGCSVAKWANLLRDNWLYGEDLYHWSQKDLSITIFSPKESCEKDGIIVSKHAAKRIHERCGIGKKAGKKLAERAFRDGLRIEDTTGIIRSYMAHVFYNTEESPEICLLDNYIFVFKKQEEGYVLVTVMLLPQKYTKYQDKEIKREVFS